MKDYIIRVTAAEGTIRAFAGTTTSMVDHARRVHGLYPLASAALGRTMTAAAMLGIDMKDKRHTLSIIIKGGGPIGSIIVVARSDGKVKGYVDNPAVELPLNTHGKLDVGAAVGRTGKITIIRDLGLKEPYAGQVDLVSGEIAEDIANYMAVSEQQPSAVALGVLVNPDASVKAAGGFIIQVMPGASEQVIKTLEDNLAATVPVSQQIEEGRTPEEILQGVLGEYKMKINDRVEPGFFCDCNRERLKSLVLSLGADELRDIIETDGQAELVCHYCNKKYLFHRNELKQLLEKAK